MRKLYTLVGCASVFAGAGYGQDSISNKSWYTKINQSFANVATGQGDAVNLANYGAFEPVNGNFKLNIFGPLSDPKKSKAVFFNVSGEGKLLGDNIGVLFNNSKINTGVKLLGKIHLPIYQHIDVSGNEVETISYRIKLLEDERKLQHLKIQLNADSAFIKNAFRADSLRFIGIKKIVNDTKGELKNINSQIQIHKGDTAQFAALLKKAGELFGKNQQLISDSLKLNNRLDSLAELAQDALLVKERANALTYKIDEEIKKKRDSLELSVIVKASSFGWISLVGNFERKKYYSLIDSLPFSQHFRENKYSTYAYGLELNFIGYSANKRNPVAGKFPITHVVNLGLIRMQDNDIARFTTSEMTESKRYALGDSTRTVATKYNVYPQTIMEFEAWKVYMNYYITIGKKKNMAIHFFPDVSFWDSGEKPANLGFGYILSVKNKKLNTLFNVEVYAKFLDIGKALPQIEEKALKRNEIGLNLGLPLNFLSSK